MKPLKIIYTDLKIFEYNAIFYINRNLYKVKLLFQKEISWSILKT